MATLRRKDNKGRVLKEGEYQRTNGTYRFRWLDKRHKEHSIYAKTLEELRVEEKKILKDTLDGINASSNLTLNDMYERWREVKRGLKDNTFQNYQYMYDTFVKPDFGKGLLTEIKKSDVRRFYNDLKEKRRLKCSTIDSIHTVVHQVFDLAVGDDYIRNNPSDDALKELRRTHVEEPRDIRALTVKEQELFEYVLNDPRHKRWQPVFTAILWTGMRVGEITGLRWCDIDFEKNLISVNHTLVYYDQRKNAKGQCAYAIHTPKTKAGCRMIPMLPEVREALLEEKKYQELEDVKCVDKIDGYTNFVFLNRFGSVLNQGTLNKALDRIVRNCNLDVIEKGKRDAVILPPLSNHWLRHTFATRMVESGMHPKALQEILGHKDISTTMNIYTDASTDFTSNEMEKFRVSRLERNNATYQSLTNDLPMITKLA